MEDLRNFCSKVDVDTIRAKIPPMPQIKLPKSVSKIKPRKFFRISRQDFSSISRRVSSKRTASDKSENIALPPLGVIYPPIPPSGFIDRTPTRISTISSLMNQKIGKDSKIWQTQNNDDEENENSYRNAGGIDDYYPSPMSHRYEQRMSQPISPLKAPPHISQKFKTRSQQNVKMSFGEKLHKGYKDLTEFKLKHLFAKRTVVHADKIEVNSYIPSFEEDRKRDEKLQRKIDRNIADNYRFQFKVSQQKSEESVLEYDSPESSPENFETLKSLKSDQSGDGSDMESSPPNRPPGIAATRFSRVRRTPLNMSLEDVTYNENNENVNKDLMNNVKKPHTKSTQKTNYDNRRRKSLKSIQNTLSLNMSQEEIIDFDDDNDDNIEIEDVESPKIKPNKNIHSQQIPRRKSVKGISATLTSKDRNAPINRTQEEDLDVSDGDIEFNEIDDVKSPKMKSENTFYSRQNPRRKSEKGIAATITTKDRNAPINRTQEEDLDVSDGDIDEVESSFSNDRHGREEDIDDGDIELNGFKNVELSERNPVKRSKSPDNIKYTREVPRRKSARGIVVSSEFSINRLGFINKTQEEDLESDNDVDMNEELQQESPKIKQREIGFEITSDSHRHYQRNMPLAEDSYNDSDEMHENFDLNVVEEENSPKIKPNTSSLYDIKKHKTIEKTPMSKSIRERMSRLTKQKIGSDETNKPASEKKRRAPSSPEAYLDNDGTRKSEKPFDAIKTNLKRIHKSIKLPQNMTQQSGAVSENDEANSEIRSKHSKTHQFSEHLKRFRSTDTIDKTSEEVENNIKYNITSKLQGWKNSLKKKVDSHSVDNEDDYGANSPQKQVKPVGSLIKKLRHIRTRRRDSTDDPDDDEEGGETYKESLASRAKLRLEKGAVAASQMPQLTMKKISETKKLFKKKQDENNSKKKTNNANTDEEDLNEGDVKMQTSPKNTIKGIPSRPPPPLSRPYFNDSEEELDDVDNHKFISKSIAESQLISVPSARTVWATKPILSDDTSDYEEDLPRVVLHQDNSNVFEPTLIIAVTRPLPCTTSTIITELPPDSAEESTPDTKSDNWIPNQDMIATFLEMTPPSQQKFSKDANLRNQSTDSSSDDSWIKDIPKGPSTAIHINQEPWMYQRNIDDTLYKTKSIDLFEMQKEHGGVSCAFEDFDDELRNTPVVKVEKQITSIDETETDDNDEFKDFDDEFQTESLVKTELENRPSIEMVQQIMASEEMETEEFKDFEDEVKTLLVTDNDKLVEMEKEVTFIDKIDNRKTDSEENICITNAEEQLRSISNTVVTNTPLLRIENNFNIIDEAKQSEELKIILVHRNIDDYQRDSSEELEIPDDDNSSRVTKIDVYCQQSKENETTKLKSGCLNCKENDNVELDNSSHREEELDHPPSKTPSPPPIPQRKPSLKQLSLELDCPSLPPPPLPVTKPPLPPNKPVPAPPKIPDRNSTQTIAKPLVKTASLRLAYNEQVNPKDIGKVNKLISRFETEAPNRRPRIIHRKPYRTNESDESSESEDLIQLLPKKYKDKTINNIPKLHKNLSIDSVDISDKNVEVTLIDIQKNNDKNYASKNNTENQNKCANSVKVSNKDEKEITPIDISDNINNKFTRIDIPEITKKNISIDSADIPIKNPKPSNIGNNIGTKSAITDNDNRSTSIDISEIHQKSITTTSDEIPQIQQTPCSIDSVDVSESNETKSTATDIPETQQKPFVLNSVDVLNKNENKPPIDDIPEIQHQPEDVSDNKENYLKSAPRDISNYNVIKSTPIDIPEVEQKSTPEHSTDIPDENNRQQNILKTKQKSISKDSVDIPDKTDDEIVSTAISNNLDDKIKTIDIENMKLKSSSIDLTDSSIKNETKCNVNCDNKSTLIEKLDINNKNSKPIDTQAINNNISISIPDIIPDMHIKSISRDLTSIPQIIDSNPINNIENKSKITNKPDKNDKTPTQIDISNINNNKTTLNEILNKNENELTPNDTQDRNANTPISEQETHSSSLVDKTNLDFLEDNNIIIDPVPNISIYSNNVDINLNFGQPNSVYGSPLDSPVESTEVTPIPIRKESDFLDTKRNRRNVDNENIASFDSDDENSYYSISSTSSNRYVVDL